MSNGLPWPIAIGPDANTSECNLPWPKFAFHMLFQLPRLCRFNLVLNGDMRAPYGQVLWYQHPAKGIGQPLPER